MTTQSQANVNIDTNYSKLSNKKKSFIKKFKEIYLTKKIDMVYEFTKNKNQILYTIEKQQKRYRKILISSMVKKCRHQSPKYTARCLKNLLKLKQSASYKNMVWINQAIDSLTLNPLVLTHYEEKRALKAVNYCAKKLQTDDFKQKNIMIKNLTRLSYCNSFLVRNAAKNSLKGLENRHHVNCEDALEEALMDVEKHKIMILQNHENSSKSYDKIIFYLDSYSPSVRHLAEDVFKQTVKVGL